MNDALEQLKQLLVTGDETGARDFIARHFKEFPEALQKEIMVAMFEEALAEERALRGAALSEKREAVKLIEALERYEKEHPTA